MGTNYQTYIDVGTNYQTYIDVGTNFKKKNNKYKKI